MHTVFALEELGSKDPKFVGAAESAEGGTLLLMTEAFLSQSDASLRTRVASMGKHRLRGHHDEQMIYSMLV